MTYRIRTQHPQISSREWKSVQRSAFCSHALILVLNFAILPFSQRSSGYACLFALQREVKELYGIAGRLLFHTIILNVHLDDGSKESVLYGIAASFIYIGNLVFRLGHNIIFAKFYPRTRVVLFTSPLQLLSSTFHIAFTLQSTLNSMDIVSNIHCAVDIDDFNGHSYGVDIHALLLHEEPLYSMGIHSLCIWRTGHR